MAYQLNNLEILRAEHISKWKRLKIEKDNILLKLRNVETVKNEILNQNAAEIDTTKLKKDFAQSKEKQSEEALTKREKLMAENQNSEGSSNSIIYWFIVISIIVVISLYWLGKKSKENNETKDLGD